MTNLKEYSGDSFEFHKEVIKGKYTTKKDPDYKERIGLLNSEIEVAFSNYRTSFIGNNLEALKPIGYTGQNKEDLKSLYSFKNPKIQELLKIVTTTATNRKRSICSNCTVSEVNSFDHILPQTDYSEFSVNPLNLLPSCTNCNSRKGVHWVVNGKKLFINHYIDLLPDVQLLQAEIDVKNKLEIEIKFLLLKPEEVSQEVFDLIQSHYTKLKLFKRFAENSDDVISEFENEIGSFSRKLSRKEIEECITDMIGKNMILYGKNYWKCVLTKKLAQNEDFMSRFTFK